MMVVGTILREKEEEKMIGG